jgi:hypothetical protein
MTHDLEKLGGISTRLAARASKLEWKLWSDGVLWTLGWAWIECIQTIKEFSSMSKEVSHIAPGCRTQPRFLPFPMLYAVLYASSCTWPWVTQAVGHLLSLKADSDGTTFSHSLETIVESEWLNVRLLDSLGVMLALRTGPGTFLQWDAAGYNLCTFHPWMGYSSRLSCRI